MEYNEHNKPIEDRATQVLLENITHRLNDQSCVIANLHTKLVQLESRMDEATHMTSEEFGNQVTAQVATSMPTLMAAAMKQTKRGGR